jgi:pyruvate dehydrogenase E2 component (dihydrolipoamide acetyltransferase)
LVIIAKKVMAEKVLMLALSPTMETGTIAKWNKQEGETVASGDVLCEVETDKAVMDYESMQEGTLLKIVLAEGGEAKVGESIAIIGEEGEDITELLQEAPSAPQPSSTAPEAPKEASPASPSPGSAAVAPPTSSGADGRIKASPLARAMAKDAGLDLSAISGSGPGGRIVKRDIEQALESPVQGPAPEQPGVTAVDEVIPVSKKRTIIAQRLAESKYSAPHYYVKIRVIMDDVLSARNALNARSAKKFP